MIKVLINFFHKPTEHFKKHLKIPQIILSLTTKNISTKTFQDPAGLQIHIFHNVSVAFTNSAIPCSVNVHSSILLNLKSYASK